VPDFMVLRNAAAVRTASPFESLGPAAAARNAPEPRVEVHNVPESEAIDLARDPQVAAVAKPMPTSLIEPLEVARTAATSAWGIAAVKADTSNFTGDGVVVAVLDTGIDQSHPAFAGVTIVEQDFSGSGNGDRQGHGTHCAGTIFGRDVTGTRIGIARGVKKALIGKVLGDDGGGSSDMIFRGIQYNRCILAGRGGRCRLRRGTGPGSRRQAGNCRLFQHNGPGRSTWGRHPIRQSGRRFA
jgi:subtilisin family serine protease